MAPFDTTSMTRAAFERAPHLKEWPTSPHSRIPMALRLYDHPLSPYGQKVKIALIEKGVEFEGMLPNAIGSGQVDDEFAAANPRGEVPALIDGDAAIFDSTVILEYIEDKWPKPALLPATPIDRARVRMLEDVMDTHFEAITWALSEIRNFGTSRRCRGSSPGSGRRGRDRSLACVARAATRIEALVQRRRVRLGRLVRGSVPQRCEFVRSRTEDRYCARRMAIARERPRQRAQGNCRSRHDGHAGRERRHGRGAAGVAGRAVQTRIPRSSSGMDDPQRRTRRRARSASSVATSASPSHSVADTHAVGRCSTFCIARLIYSRSTSRAASRCSPIAAARRVCGIPCATNSPRKAANPSRSIASTKAPAACCWWRFRASGRRS